MPLRHASSCFVPGCKSGSKAVRRNNKKNGIKNPSLFGAPKDPKMLKLWDLAICRMDRTLTSRDAVCELHFEEDEVMKYYETVLRNGEIHRIERAVFTLKKNAVPSIFPTHHCRNSKKTRGCPADRLSLVPNPQDCDVDELDMDFEMNEVKTEVFDFKVLMNGALNVLLPSDMWTVGVLKGNQVIFANWSDGETFEARKRVLINSELQVKIFFGNINAALENMKEVHSLAEVSAFLIVIDQLKICESARSSKCLGCIIPRDVTDKGTSATICRHCQKADKVSLESNSENEVVSGVGLQNKILRQGLKSSQLGDILPKKKRKLSPEKEVVLDGNPSLVGAVDGCVSGEAFAVDDSETESVEVDIEERAPPRELRSTVTPLHLLSTPPEDIMRPSSVPPQKNEEWEEFALPLNIKDLVRDVDQIPLPSDAWTLGVVKSKCIIFACWKEGKVLEAEKRMVVDEDLSVKVIIGNTILALNEIFVEKIGDVGRYLYIVNKMRKCNGIGTGRRAPSCPGYFIPVQRLGIQSCISRCAFCQGASEELMRIENVKESSEHTRAEVQEKAYKYLKKLSGLYPEMKKGVKSSAS